MLVALSGGSDSVALTHLLLELSQYREFEVIAVAHLNHRLRASAARDEQFCRDFASRVRLDIVVEGAEVQSFAIRTRKSLEDAARRLRYEFLDRAAAHFGAGRIAVGHTRDDQAETLLMKLMRGAGPTGLAGIYPSRGPVIRPLLDVARADLRDYLAARGERWVEDETNDEVHQFRNRVRHVVLPELDRAFGGSTRPNIARAAALIREDTQWLDQLGFEWFDRIVVEVEGGLEVDGLTLVEAPAPVRRRVLLQALRRVAGGDREIGQDHVEAVLALLEGSQGGPVDVPGSRVELRRGKLVLIQQGAVVR